MLPFKRDYDGVTVYHPRIANRKPSRIFSKPHPERYVEAIEHFFRSQGIKLDPANDIFYSQWLPEANFVNQAAHKLGVKSVVLAIGDDVVVWPYRNANTLDSFSKTWRQADVRCAVARYLAEEANKLVGESLSYQVIRRGVEYQSFQPATVEQQADVRKQYGVASDRFVILSIGSSIKRKGWLDLLDALAVCAPQHKQLLLVAVHAGDTDLDLDTEVAARNLQQHFLNLGEVLPNQVSRLFGLADIFCLPSHWEGIANAVVEAMSSGLPVITTSVCGHPELISSGQNGILVAPKQPDQIAHAINMLVADEHMRNTLGKNARNFIVNEWGSFQQNAANLYKVLQNTLAKR
jgi:glycosyltransferase involved in cell wall biosynthesis